MQCLPPGTPPHRARYIVGASCHHSEGEGAKHPAPVVRPFQNLTQCQRPRMAPGLRAKKPHSLPPSAEARQRQWTQPAQAHAWILTALNTGVSSRIHARRLQQAPSSKFHFPASVLRARAFRHAGSCYVS